MSASTGRSWTLSLVGVTGGVVEEVARGLDGVLTERGGCFMVLVSGINPILLLRLYSMDGVEINWRINAQ